MVKGGSLRARGSVSRKKTAQASYDYLQEIIGVASKSGWDVKSLGLVDKDLPANPEGPLTKKQFQELNRRVRNILKRYAKDLTPPVPLDLEKSIRMKDEKDWLPWEEEAIQKIESWRNKLKKLKPDILEELNNVELSPRT